MKSNAFWLRSADAICYRPDLAAFLFLRSNSEKKNMHQINQNIAICCLFQNSTKKTYRYLELILIFVDEHTPFLFPRLQLGGWREQIITVL